MTRELIRECKVARHQNLNHAVLWTDMSLYQTFMMVVFVQNRRLSTNERKFDLTFDNHYFSGQNLFSTIYNHSTYY